MRQNDQSDCGAAALATIALHHGMPIGLQQVRELAGTDRIGTNLRGLLTAAERIGLSARAVKGPYDALAEVPLPAVAHVRNDEGLGHFVVLQRFRKKRVTVADPARGVRVLSREEFCKCWTGYLVIVVPDETRRADATRTVPTAAWRRFLRLLGSHRSIFVEGFFCALLMMLLGITTSYFVQHLVDSVLVRGETRLLNALGIGMLFVVLFRSLFGVLRRYLLAHVGRRIDLSLVSGYARHILGLPARFFEMRQVGEILSRVNDAAKVRDAISGTALTVMVDGVVVLISLAVLWAYDAWLALVASTFVPVLLGVGAAHHSPIRRRSQEAMENDARFSAQLVEDISGVETVKAYGLERVRSEEGESRLLRVVESVFSLEKLGISMGGAGTFVTGIAGIVILWYGGHRVVAGAITVGELLFFYTLLAYMLDPLERLATVNLQIQDALVAINRLYEVMDLELEELESPAKAKFERVRDSIRFEDVSFGYGCRGSVLEKVDLEIPAGSTVAIVGESGSGKSTLLKLLSRFHEPMEGRIVVDDLDIRDFELTSLRSRIGLVSQEPYIFTGSIRENVALGRPSTTLDEILDVIRAAGLGKFVDQLPERHETVIGERGANLSGGQRQRLAIARALLRRPEILIFDEATSHLDTATERAIRESLRRELADKTVVLVAHRLSTVMDADMIYVLDAGRVAEKGSHGRLMAQGGIYASLWSAQSEGAGAPAAAPVLPGIGLDTPVRRGANGSGEPCAIT